ncbi:GAF domain-containing protein [Actinacidiphila alni]|uniref:protein-serine/threonine phosphatase n=1 Tax=Actinacidiphila alni TaxID=380248 RepID=A0A1I2HDZ8_9ACTN|nr:SpoIIE family protein phosphatase [Actinacidiphila alni]SFF27147.1 GAF domain-containing protein [Actinacidiphila alni]
MNDRDDGPPADRRTTGQRSAATPSTPGPAPDGQPEEQPDERPEEPQDSPAARPTTDERPDPPAAPPATGEQHDEHPDRPAELRQIDALNEIPPGRDEAGAGPGGDRTREGGAGGAGQAPRQRDVTLIEAGRALAEATSLEEVFTALASLDSPAFPLDGMAVFGVTEKSLNLLGRYGYRTGGGRTVRMPITTDHPATEVLRTGRAVYLPTVKEYRERFPTTWRLAARKGSRSWALLPLVSTGRITGVWLVAFTEQVEFDGALRNTLVTLARLMSRALDRTHTGEAELALSRGLRSSMGRGASQYRGMTVASRYVPTGGGLMVGGDWYDVIDLPSDRLALVIGDVQGHDLHAATLMAQLRTAVHAYAAEGHGPDAVLSRTSRFLTSLDEDRFATCIYIEADPGSGTLHVARAGHPHPVLRMPDGTCMIKHIRGGLPLGLMPDEDDYPVNVLELQAGEVMMLCTDGLIETGGHDMYSGWVRVRDALSPGPADDLEGMADRLVQGVVGPVTENGEERLTPRNEDDIALLMLRRDTGAQHPVRPVRRILITIEQDQAEGLAEARTELRALLHDWTQPDQVDTAVLLASELLGNVLVHTDQSAALMASVSGEPGTRTLRVEVTDSGDELPHQRTPGEMASSGRGLVLLDILSDQWSVRPESEGKTVWFELAEESVTGDGAGPV